MPSEKILNEKKEKVAQLAEKIKGAKSGVFVDYKGINVKDDTGLRVELRKAGVEYLVVKNSLVSLAAKEAGYEALADVFKGSTAMAISEDFIAPAKILCKYAKNSKTNFSVKAGFVDGEVLDAEGVNTLAAIPSREGLIAKLLGSMQSSLYGLAYVLQAKIDKESEAAGA